MTIETSVAALPATLHELLEARAGADPEMPFLLAEDAWWTLRDLNRHAGAIALALRARGIGSGDRVVVMMQGCERYLALWFAISKLGAVEVPINGAYRGEILTHILRTADARLAIVDASGRAAFDQAAVGVLETGVVIDAMDACLDWDPACAEAPSGASLGTRLGATDASCVIFTSGTTGLSKGVVVGHRHQLSFGMFFGEIAGLRTDDTVYNFLPFFHIAAKFQTLGILLAGGRMALRPVFSLSAFWGDVRTSGATVCVAVGGLCHLLNSVPPSSADRDNTLRLIYAVPVPWEFRNSFEQRFGLNLVEAYGGTESNLNIYSRPDEPTPRGSCGRASPHFEISIRDEFGFELPRGAAGEICVRPHAPGTMMTSYLGLPERTLAAFQDCWFHTGDRARMDEAGYVFFLDRLKDTIRRRGENISSFEVERALAAHPDVAEVAVIPVQADLGEDEVKAVVVRKPGVALSHEALLTFAVGAMPYFMVPRFIEFREDLPRTPTMKIKKAELREEGRSAATWDCEQAGIKITRRGLENIHNAVGAIPAPASPTHPHG